MEDTPRMEVPDMPREPESPVVAEQEERPDYSSELRSLDVEETVEESLPEPCVPCEFTCGVAGSGKTWLWRERIKDCPSDGILAATTGIAAVNLGTITLNSLLGYFDTNSLRDSYLSGQLVRRLRALREDHRRIVIDEVSMLDGDQLSILVRGALEANSFKSKQPPLGIACVGDFAQLSPVKARWAFESDEWWRFEEHTTRLTKVWRQDAGPFLTALNFTRSGDGATAADILTSEGLEWNSALDINFSGTTIVPKNDQVSRYNAESLSRLPDPLFHVESRRWGKQRSEWGRSQRTGEWGIPLKLALKKGAWVTFLSNFYDGDHNLVYANGDGGWIDEHIPSISCVRVRLARNDRVVSVYPLVRDVSQKDKPDGWARGGGDTAHGEWCPRPHWMVNKKRFVLGQVEYLPLQLAYASTVHRSQGLSLDRVQFDFRNDFAKQPAMMYVSMSRCRSLAGLRLVGQPERFVRQVNIDERVRPWL